jgi:hypothetical protein
MPAESEIEISPEQIEALRTILTFAKSKEGLGLTRRELSIATSVREADVDNFIGQNKAKGTAKTARPPPRKLSRLLTFAATDRTLVERIAKEPETSKQKAALAAAQAAFRLLPMYSTDDDHFFLYLNRIHAMNVKKCLSICSLLSAYYYGYRFSGTAGRIIRSHFEVKPFDPTRKLPNFSHHLRYGKGGTVRRTAGQILEVGQKLIFTGFATGSTYDDYEGVKFMVMDRGNFGKAPKLNGMFISYAGRATHQIGFIQLVATERPYKENMIGEYSLEEVQRDDPNFDVSEIRKNVSALLDGGFLVAALS